MPLNTRSRAAANAIADDIQQHIEEHTTDTTERATLRLLGDRAEVRFRAVNDACDPNAAVGTRQAFVVRSGEPGVRFL